MTTQPQPTSATPYYVVDDTHSGELGREVWVLGPPGTGKTTFLSGSVRNTATMRGADNVVVTSFTTAAAAELASRGLPLPRSNIGTLHSLAYRALEAPPVAVEQYDDWNTRHPVWALSAGQKVSVDDGAPVEAGVGGATEGDQLLNQLDSLRARQVPADKWDREVADFAHSWSEWKRGAGVVDFTDMIEQALEAIERAPSMPDVIFADEVQDFTPLELALVRKWGQYAERLVLAGDPNQSIYGFKGATPDAWLDQPVPDSDKLVLSQSWRIPSTVHAAAEHWIRQQSRFERMEYHPRDEPGLVRNIAENYLQVGQMVDRIEASLEQTVVEDGEQVPATVMVLASCGYMLDPIRHELRRRGVPFHNPYRRSRGDWNPMKPAARGQVTSRERLLAYLILDDRAFGDAARPWTGQDIRRWTKVTRKQGVLVRGAQQRIEALPDGEVPYETIAELFVDETELEQAVMPDLAWFERNLLAAAKAGMDFPLQVAKVRGPAALTETPRVVLGTIHSVKGGQASVVYLIPDLSSRGSAEWEKPGPTADGVRRLMYVGMTRARSELAVMMPASTLYVPPEQMVAGARANAA